MTPVVLIPFRADSEQRKVAYQFVMRFWSQFGWPIHTAPGPEGLFNRSAARNEAARAASWDVAIFADADTVGEPKKIRRAIEVAASGKLAYPFNEYNGLTVGQTKSFLAGGNPGIGKRIHGSPGGILAVSRLLFDEVGGYDEQFRGWGYEDLAFMYAAGTLGGLHRERGRITHLWHPHANEKRAAFSGKGGNRARKDRYAAANGNPEAMRALLAELR